jgi:ATP-dependent RNA helicase DDX3X
VETSGRDVPAEIKTFEECNPPMPAALYDNIKRCGYSKPTPVQRYALPICIAGRDLMACAQVRA